MTIQFNQPDDEQTLSVETKSGQKLASSPDSFRLPTGASRQKRLGITEQEQNRPNNLLRLVYGQKL